MNNNTYDLSTWGVGAIVGASLLGLVIWVVFLIAYIKIISKAGYSGWWVLIMFVPIVNVVMLLIFAYKEWPIERELAELRSWANQIQRGPGPQQFGNSQQFGGGQPGGPQPYGGGQPGGPQNPYQQR
ncbi:DUF805 domain-containing protein [Nakamurella multipartita]|uniref:Uncharacterized protein n=1 Tax=Nakamurella multipartita (strain ATCC 700099 / DSM 44233 / CIP 104796 / JCM 9543 / NBRC 105858 / Y-104) TaxID=479431 RepID=C8XAX0_NAKMY|nr:DUF805 domain-containing protein [Nakamurella multipartita]ACV79373.1 hypothetical protein Namu_3036 [Nakamurella multipartita DSM 44233]